MDPSNDELTPPSSRRAFLGQVAATATVAYLWLEGMPDAARRARITPTAPDGERKTLTAREWKTLEAALARILPSAKDSPGAEDVNAIGYLDAVLADPGVEEDAVERVHRGAAMLDEHAGKAGERSGFSSLPPESRDEGIRIFEGAWEEQLILRTLIAFALEAFLGDPVHGANPEEIGWTWAEHRPGYPRPKGPWQPVGEGPDGRRPR